MYKTSENKKMNHLDVLDERRGQTVRLETVFLDHGLRRMRGIAGRRYLIFDDDNIYDADIYSTYYYYV